MSPRTGTARGSVYVEFLVAVVPLFLFFWGILQLNGLLLADLIVRDAANNAVRAAIVCDSDQKTSGESGAMDCATQAVQDTVKAETSITSAAVSIDGASESGNGQVTATVTASYTCLVPMVSALVCGGGVATLARSASLPNQGHYYKF